MKMTDQGVQFTVAPAGIKFELKLPLPRWRRRNF